MGYIYIYFIYPQNSTDVPYHRLLLCHCLRRWLWRRSPPCARFKRRWFGGVVMVVRWKNQGFNCGWMKVEWDFMENPWFPSRKMIYRRVTYKKRGYHLPQLKVITYSVESKPALWQFFYMSFRTRIWLAFRMWVGLSSSSWVDIIESE